MSSREKLTLLARRHASSEGAGDLLDVLATLEPDPVYELWPVGRAFRGMPAARRFYEHFFSSFQPLIAGYELLREWVTDEGVGQEYRIELRFPDGREESHRVIGVLGFGSQALSGERVWASERLLQLMFGPVYEQATAIR